MQLENIDWLIISAFFILSLAIGIIVSKKSGKDVTEFFLSGRKMPWWLLGISMVATTFSSRHTKPGNRYSQNQRRCWKLGMVGIPINGDVDSFCIRQACGEDLEVVATDLEFYELRYSGRGGQPS